MNGRSTAEAATSVQAVVLVFDDGVDCDRAAWRTTISVARLHRFRVGTVSVGHCFRNGPPGNAYAFRDRTVVLLARVASYVRWSVRTWIGVVDR